MAEVFGRTSQPHVARRDAPSSALRVVPVEPVAFCAAWHARGFETKPVHGGRCCFCNRDVAVPESARGKHVACDYCGMERGLIPAVEIEPPWHRSAGS